MHIAVYSHCPSDLQRKACLVITCLINQITVLLKYYSINLNSKLALRLSRHHTTTWLAVNGLTSSMESQTHLTSKCHVTEKPLLAFIAKTPLQSRVRQTTRLVVMCTTSQCRLRFPFQNLRVTNVIFIVTYYTLPRIESSPSFWVTRSQRSRRRDKGL